MKYTPGPWRLEESKVVPAWRVLGPDDYPIVQVNVHNSLGCGHDDKANAQLIAAAPELLQALKAFVEPWEKGGENWGAKLTYDTFNNARKTISKAEGQDNG